MSELFGMSVVGHEGQCTLNTLSVSGSPLPVRDSMCVCACVRVCVRACACLCLSFVKETDPVCITIMAFQWRFGVLYKPRVTSSSSPSSSSFTMYVISKQDKQVHAWRCPTVKNLVTGWDAGSTCIGSS